MTEGSKNIDRLKPDVQQKDLTTTIRIVLQLGKEIVVMISYFYYNKWGGDGGVVPNDVPTAYSIDVQMTSATSCEDLHQCDCPA